jgi:2,5-dihydroxypyridine 5,6-dioxygenase
MLSPNQSIDAGRLADLFHKAFIGCDVRPGETVAILEGSHTPPGYADAARVAATLLGARPFGISLPSVARPFAAVPGCGEIYGATGLTDLRPAVEAMKQCDFVVDLVVLLHSAEQEEILEAGARMLMITEPPEILERMFPTDDLRRRVEASVRMIAGAKRMTIKSDAGTDITYGLGQFRPGGGWGFTTGRGSHAHWPSGLAAIYPDEGSAHGTWVIGRGDIIFPFKTFVQSRIVMDVVDGFVRSIDGDGADAVIYRDYLESWGDPEGFAMSHVGWGLNERALWNALAMLDRSATQGMDGRCFAGNVLFSTGPNNEAGGSRFTLAHSDVPVRDCSLWLDDEQILDHGRFLPAELQIVPAHVRLDATKAAR